MVNNLNKISKSNICISITGVAGPSGGAKNKPIGLVYVGLKRKNKVIVKKFNFKNMGRLYIQKKTVLNVLNLILKTI